MQDALIFLARTLLDFYALAFVLRVILQAVRASFYHPLSQFVVRITDPLVRPLRGLLRPAGSIDLATLLVLFLLQLGMVVGLYLLTFDALPGVPTLAAMAALRLIWLFLRLYFFLILLYAILSWVSRDFRNPVQLLLAVIIEPVLRPARRIVPLIGGIDLSPLLVMLLLQAVMIALPLYGFLR